MQLDKRVCAVRSVAVYTLWILVAFSMQNPLLAQETSRSEKIAGDVCPPFFLYDETGNVIDPVHKKNADKPYSPEQTCGRCHDYEKITQGYHFTQGKGEKPTPDQAARCQWASTPGNYGGTWCSPAPLYRYLSPKKNDSPHTMDMTSYSFITAGCGSCHPGGGPLEYDLEGKRYDNWMADAASGFATGGDNKYDGDYHKARWSETGVIEADCLLCHIPEYSFRLRDVQLSDLNFRWAATAGSGFAKVSGSIQAGKPVGVEYDPSLFDTEGKVSPHIVREPRDEACLACHAKPGWKKRGANFRGRTDVHLNAGLRCVDCHPSGSHADDPRIREKENHQFGKGDDPGGCVRDDLDDTCRDCTFCHEKGYLNAPVAKHRWLPPLHLEKIACQTCHIPERHVKAALFQASDVFNPGARIPTKGKHLWTFYGPDGGYWNHYGDLEMMGYDDKPTDPYRPVLAKYKGKIYPVNRVHTAWPGIETEGKPGLMQPKMEDIYKMWMSHKKDRSLYPMLAEIKDDNGDDVPEINRPEEIDALIAAVTSYLNQTGYFMEGKRGVWVYNDRVYSSGNEYRSLPMHEWEASPYGNVHKYTHDVFPARAALGINGCTECHGLSSRVFFGSVTRYPFDGDAKPITVPQYRLLGVGAFTAILGAVRESFIKPALYLALALLCFLFAAGVATRVVLWAGGDAWKPYLRLFPWLAVLGMVASVVFFSIRPELMEYMLPSRMWLDANHVLIGFGVFALGLIVLAWSFRQKHMALAAVMAGALILTAVSGGLMLVSIPFLTCLTTLSYSLFDAGLFLLVLGGVVAIGMVAPQTTAGVLRNKDSTFIEKEQK